MLSRNAGKYQMVLGLGTVLATFWGTVRFLPPFYTHTYPFAWYGMILFLDGLLWWKWDESLIAKRFREFGTLLFWSAVFWFFFEIWNLRLQNWYYAGVSPNDTWAHIESYVDFATVLPGMFLVYRLLDRLHFPRSLRTDFTLSIKWRRIAPGIGIVMFFLALAWPDYFFPLVWGAFVFLLDPLCAAKQGPSLFKDAERGDWTMPIRLLVAGALCGGYWELCNYWAQTKWIYTVPFLAQGKLFEMPYLGFLGFPPFCLECFVMTNSVYLLRNGRHWFVGYQHRALSRHLPKIFYISAVILAIMLSEWSYARLRQHTVDSHAESASQMVQDLAPKDGQALLASGWHYAIPVLRNWDKAKSGISHENRERIRRRLALASHLQMGSVNARLLEQAGIFTVKQLKREKAEPLFSRLTDLNDALKIRPTPLPKRRVNAWIAGAKRRTFLQ